MIGKAVQRKKDFKVTKPDIRWREVTDNGKI